MAKVKVEIRECIANLAAVMAKKNNQTTSSVLENAVASYIAARSV